MRDPLRVPSPTDDGLDDLFERRLRAALLAHTAGAPAAFDALGFAHDVATRAPRRHGLASVLGWRTRPTPPAIRWSQGTAGRPAWLLVAVALLTTAVVGGMLAAGAALLRRADQDPGWPAVVQPAALDACPAGSSPDAVGPVGQAHPPYDHVGAAVAFDAIHGLLVLVADAGWTSETWVLDVCTNTWSHVPTDATPEWDVMGLAYDVRLDAAVAIDVSGHAYVLDEAAGTWRRGTAPAGTGAGSFMHAFYDPVIDRVIGISASAQDVGDAFTYDVAADRWTALAPGTATALALLVFDPVDGQVIIAGDQVSFLDVRTGRASSPPAQPPDPGIASAWQPPGAFQATWDEDGQRLLTVTSDGRVLAYDPAANAWTTLYDVGSDPAAAGPGIDPGAAPRRLGGSAVAWDTVNHRLVVYSGHYWSAADTLVRSDIVQAFDPVTRTWSVLVEPTGEWPE